MKQSTLRGFKKDVGELLDSRIMDRDLEGLEEATGGLSAGTVRLACSAPACPEARDPGPKTPEYIPEDRGLESWGADADGTFRPL